MVLYHVRTNDALPKEEKDDVTLHLRFLENFKYFIFKNSNFQNATPASMPGPDARSEQSLEVFLKEVHGNGSHADKKELKYTLIM